MAKSKLTKKVLTETLEHHGFRTFPCLSTCESGDIRVYRKSGMSYYATINFVGGNLKFNGQEYDSVDSMLNAIEAYNATLEFSPATYNPDYQKNYITDMRVADTLHECGYTFTDYAYGGDGKYCSEGVLGVKFPSVCGSYLYLNDHKFITMYDKNDSDSCIAKNIKSFIGAMYAANIAQIADKLADMGSLDTLNSIPIKTMNYNTFEVTETEGIDAIINILENSLSRLKKHKKDKKGTDTTPTNN